MIDDQTLLQHFNISRTETTETVKPKAFRVICISALLFLLGAALIYGGWRNQGTQMMIYGIVLVVASIVMGRMILSGFTLDYAKRQLHVCGFICKKHYSFDEISDIIVGRSSDSDKSWFVQVQVGDKDPFAVMGELRKEVAILLQQYIIEQISCENEN